MERSYSDNVSLRSATNIKKYRSWKLEVGVVVWGSTNERQLFAECLYAQNGVALCSSSYLFDSGLYLSVVITGYTLI